MKKILFLLLLVAQVFYAQDEQKIFNSANEMYKQQNYEKAIEFYKTLESNNLVSSELFYNLGNAHYKLNQVGPAIFYYEKALQIDPDNEDVKNNLVFAKRLALDTIEELPKTFFQKININYIQKLSYNEWAIVVVSFAILGSILFLLFYFSNRPGTKRFFFVISMLSYLFLIITFFITFNQYSLANNNKIAIVFAEETEVMNAPTLNSEELFTLHEGTKVTVLDRVDNWKKIKLADGKIGWIVANEIKELDEI